jgi:curved DNA-binding protein CbpA
LRARGSTGEQIATEFRRRALLHHPDRDTASSSSDAAFIAVQRAYAVLSDAVRL